MTSSTQELTRELPKTVIEAMCENAIGLDSNLHPDARLWTRRNAEILRDLALRALDTARQPVAWKFGYRWCEACGCKCASGWCLESDACSQINEGYNPQQAHFPTEAVAINQTLRAAPANAAGEREGYTLMPNDPTMGHWDDFCSVFKVPFDKFIMAYHNMLGVIPPDGKPASPTSPLKDAAGERFDILAHLVRQREWSERTFGPGPRTAGVIDHIRKELLEIEAAPADLGEWVDVTILALDGAWRAGYSPEQIIDGIVAKQTENENRDWPHWRTIPQDKAIEHQRASPTSPSDKNGDEATG